MAITALDTPCIEWAGPRHNNGYGMRYIGTRKWYVHRWVMAQIHGEEAIEGKVVMHHCDNPPCFRYDHLEIATQGDNMRDAYAKGRRIYTPRQHARGAEHGSAKLTEDQVRAIFVDDRLQDVIAAEYGIRQSSVSRIKTGAHWAHLTVTPPCHTEP